MFSVVACWISDKFVYKNSRITRCRWDLIRLRNTDHQYYWQLHKFACTRLAPDNHRFQLIRQHTTITNTNIAPPLPPFHMRFVQQRLVWNFFPSQLSQIGSATWFRSCLGYCCSSSTAPVPTFLSAALVFYCHWRWKWTSILWPTIRLPHGRKSRRRSASSRWRWSHRNRRCPKTRCALCAWAIPIRWRPTSSSTFRMAIYSFMLVTLPNAGARWKWLSLTRGLVCEDEESGAIYSGLVIFALKYRSITTQTQTCHCRKPWAELRSHIHQSVAQQIRIHRPLRPYGHFITERFA